MNLILNGRKTEVENQIQTITDLLSAFNLNEKLAIVEHNLNIIERSDYSVTRLANGDVVEIVQFVGGG